MKKIIASLIFVSTSFTALGMETNQATQQPARQSMELTTPLIQERQEDDVRETLALAICGALCASVCLCLCDKCCPCH